jgi:hypothetical protein
MGIYILMAFTAIGGSIVGYFMLQNRTRKENRAGR